MTSYICIGKGKTDANGVAQLTHDCQGNVLQSPGYVGQGKGKLNVVASTDSPSSIGESSLLTKTYEVLDCKFFDDGVTNPKTVSWWKWQNNGSSSIDSTGTLIDGTNGLMFWFASPDDTTPTFQSDVNVFTAPYCVEFDVVEVSGTCFLDHQDGNQRNKDLIVDLGATDNCHIKSWNDGKKIYYETDGVSKGTYNTSTGSTLCGVGLRANQGGKLKYKNFVIYPI